jgi:asparagine synthase (glutamine-hydrolysing)
MLRKVDTATMASGLEARAPFLAPGVAATALALTRQQLWPAGQRKGLLRLIARKRLPAEIVDRPKMGFAIPIGEWFRTDHGGMRQLLHDHLESAEPWGNAVLGIELNRRYIRRMLDEHMQERRDHGQRLYMLLVLSIWAKWLTRP